MKKIYFCLPTTLSNSGGTKMVCLYAEFLNRNYTDICCHVVYPIYPSNIKRWKYKSLKTLIKYWGTFILNKVGYQYKKFNKQYSNINFIRIKSLYHIKKIVSEKDAVVVATAWDTVLPLSECTCKKIYFIQSYELWNGPEKLVRQTYSIDNMQFITISGFIQNIIQTEYNKKCLLIHNFMTKPTYSESTVKKFVEKIYGVIYRNIPCKGFDAIIQFLSENAVWQNKMICVGMDVPHKYHKFFKHIIDGSRAEGMAQFYGMIDILLYTSSNEGFGLSIIEAMNTGVIVACKKTGIAYEIENKPRKFIEIETCQDERTDQGIVFTPVKADDIKQTLEIIEKLDSYECREISKQAKVFAQNFYSEKFKNRCLNKFYNLLTSNGWEETEDA